MRLFQYIISLALVKVAISQETIQSCTKYEDNEHDKWSAVGTFDIPAGVQVGQVYGKSVTIRTQSVHFSTIMIEDGATLKSNAVKKGEAQQWGQFFFRLHWTIDNIPQYEDYWLNSDDSCNIGSANGYFDGLQWVSVFIRQ